MMNNSRLLLVVLLTSSLIIFAPKTLFAENGVLPTIITTHPILLELTTHEAIVISSDTDFEVFPGTGTAEDPYLIEGYNITTTDFNGIYIRGTTKYFVIRNCYVDAGINGIYVDDASSGTAAVVNNTCDNNDYGIKLESSGNSTVTNNNCSNNGRCGIRLESFGNSTVVNNNCNNNLYGIVLDDSNRSMVANNTFTNCGLYISEDNIDAYLLYTVENNWVNGKKLGFYTNLDSTIISESVYGQLILINCTLVTVHNQILNNASTGLFLRYCTYLDIINNTCNNNLYGIVLDDSIRSTVANNNCNNNYWGIVLDSSVNSTVTNNICDNNDWSGISLWSSNRSTVANNNCSNNLYGIFLQYSAFCIITYNLLQENEKYGVYLFPGSDNNFIHHNNFVDNNLGGTSQARDECTNNYWYDIETLEGNYWSDWTGTGNYPISGSAFSVDLYPLDEPIEYIVVMSTTDETQIYFTFILLIVVVPLLLTKLFSRKNE